MSLFKCTNCGCIENTAVCNYWVRGDSPAVCSECDPGIKKWHDIFPKEQAGGMMIGADGFLYPKDREVKHTKIIGPA